MKTKTATLKFYGGTKYPEIELTGYDENISNLEVQALAIRQIRAEMPWANIKGKPVVKTVESE